MHPNKHDEIVARQEIDITSRRKGSCEANADIMDLIVALIAKENMPIRIVESEHFTRLLRGKLTVIDPYTQRKFTDSTMCV